MHAVHSPWPCPNCAELVPTGLDCPACGLSADWIDLILAVDYAIRQFHYFNITGEITRAQYRLLVADCRQRHDELVHSGKMGRALPEVTGLPPRLCCWNCGGTCAPDNLCCKDCGLSCSGRDALLIRYQTFLCQQIRDNERQGLLSPPQASRLVAHIAAARAELKQRLEAAGLPKT
jgi:hypothetical protein